MTPPGAPFDIRDHGKWRRHGRDIAPEADANEDAAPENDREPELESDPRPTTARTTGGWPERIQDAPGALRAWVLGPYAGLRITLLVVAVLALTLGALAGPGVQSYYLYDQAVGREDVQGSGHSVLVVHRVGPPTFERLTTASSKVGFDPADGKVAVVTVMGFNGHKGTLRWSTPDGDSERIWHNGRDLTPSNGLSYLGFPLDQAGTYRLLFDGPGGGFPAVLDLTMYTMDIHEQEFSQLQTKAGFSLLGLAGVGVIGVEMLARRS